MGLVFDVERSELRNRMKEEKEKEKKNNQNDIKDNLPIFSTEHFGHGSHFKSSSNFIDTL